MIKERLLHRNFGDRSPEKQEGGWGRSDDDDDVYSKSQPAQDSAYPEVRASVPPVDNLELPQCTLRMWVLGFGLVTVANAATLVLSMHQPSVSISPYLVTIVSWPLGRLWEYAVPKRKIFGIELNPGPFNIKEHALITIFAISGVEMTPSYGADFIVTVEKYYPAQPLTLAFKILLTISTQIFGLAIAGLSRRVLVYPASMIWPGSLVQVTLLTNIHVKANHIANSWRISRLKVFIIVSSVGAAYQWLPSYFMAFLSNFSVGPWISPNNTVINQLFGPMSGAGLLPISFDWNQMSSYYGSPLVPPLGTFLNFTGVLILIIWVVIPILHFSNTWYGRYLPLFSTEIFDRYQQPYDTDRVMKDNRFDLEAYKNYSPMFMSETLAISYGMSFASITSMLTHTLLFDLREIIRYWKKSANDPNDIHMRLMLKYPEVPWLVYVILLIVSVIILAVITKVYSALGVGSMFLALGLMAITFVPIGGIMAMTNVQIALNVISEFIVGYIKPGDAIAMMLFKTYAFWTSAVGLLYAQNMKMAHYIKIAPWALFAVQAVGSIWGSIVQVLVLLWATNNIDGFCSPNQALGYTCPLATVFYTASAIWGVIGPVRVFKMYGPLLYFFLVGAAMPVISWLWLKKWPRSLVRYIHWPVFFSAMGVLPPATPYIFGMYTLVGLTFGLWIRRYWFHWWAKYNYTLSAGLDMGLAIGQLIIYIVGTGANLSMPNWWGNVGAFENIDGRAQPAVVLKNGQSFGPATW